MTDIAVILARGLGTRMRRPDPEAELAPEQEAAAAAGWKAMIPVGRPFLDYVISSLADAQYRTVCLVVGPDHDLVVRRYTQEVCPRRVEIRFAVQPLPRGTADAVAAAEPLTGASQFVVLNGDNYYPGEALQALRRACGSAAALFDQEALLAGSNISAERIRAYAVAEIDRDGWLERIVEKPDEAALERLGRPLWVSMNCWRFTPAIYEACRRISPSPRGELELPDAVQYAMERLGERFRAICVRAPVLDLTCRRDVPWLAARLRDVRVEL